MGQFDDSHVIVTGAAGGIGTAIVDRFLDEGAQVLGIDFDERHLVNLVGERRGAQLDTLALDLRDPAAIAACMRWAATLFDDRIDVLVNCAGIAQAVPILDITLEQWDDTLDTNLRGAFLMSQEAARRMVKTGGGSIVNICSVDAFIAESPFADYNASKAGLVQLTKCMAFELAHLGIRCNAIAPGFTMTPMMDYAGDDATYEQYMSVIPMRRWAAPEEQANVVLFLASRQSSYINGVTIRVDGGILHGFWSDPSLAPPVPKRPEPRER
jgi:NAD(P)-dependent dehydrogenase (short-subunit alcohol dehydrogenase family)